MASRTLISCATLLVLVGVATTSPFKKEEPEPTVYYQVLDQHSGYGEHAGYGDHSGYEEHDYDHNAILAARQAPVLDGLSEAVRIKAQVLLGKVFVATFGLYVVYVIAAPYSLPEVRSLHTPVTRLLDDKDFLIDAMLTILELAAPSGREGLHADHEGFEREGLHADHEGFECRQRFVCEAVAQAMWFPFFSSHVGNFEMAAARPFKYGAAADRGAGGGDCAPFLCPRTSSDLMTGWTDVIATTLPEYVTALTDFVMTAFISS